MVGVSVLALFFFAAPGPEQRAVDFLSAEVPKWQHENGCFSCHNNGDAARALYAAARRGYAVPQEALAGTTKWLADPAGWDHNPGTPGFNNARLARIQFAAALADAVAGGFAPRTALAAGARVVSRDQDSTGAWKIDTGGAPGAPATYGTALATYMSRRVLEASGPAEFAGAIAKADRYLESARPENVLDGAAILVALPRSAAVREKCLRLVLAAQNGDGGWGPQARTPSEAFDTAIVVLAMEAMGDRKRAARGRAFLVARQMADGSWMETTRPAGGISYAEHISTSAWVLSAMVGM